MYVKRREFRCLFEQPLSLAGWHISTPELTAV
jgi:hypothetical protein